MECLYKADDKSMKSVAEIFETMEYGPVSEGSDLAKAWIENHGKKFQSFVNGVTVQSTNSQSNVPVVNPCTREELGYVIEASDADISASVNIKASEQWRKLSSHIRAKHLYSIARHIQQHVSLLVQMEALNRGVQIKDPREWDVPAVVRCFYYYAGWAELQESEFDNWEPYGMVAAVTSASSPLVMLALQVAPALAAGNTVVIKPSRSTCLPTLVLAEICSEAGLPPGVLNVILGCTEVGRKLIANPSIMKISFCGNTATGKLVRKETAGLGKSLSLLLGGKTPLIVFDTADLDSAVEAVVEGAWFNQGQVPWAISRLLVQQSVYRKFIEKLKLRMNKLNSGNAFDKLADVGVPVKREVVDSVFERATRALKEGAEVHQVGSRLENYLQPTLISGIQMETKLIEDDGVLPLIVAAPFRTAKEAIALANNTCYGMAASVWTENNSLAIEVSKQLQVGTVWINSHNIVDAGAEFGGWKQSGLGCFGGKQGLFEYMKPQEYKEVQLSHEKINFESFKTAAVADGLSPNELAQNASEEGKNIKVDHTYKLYYGGAQKRPDGNASRLIKDFQGKKFALVGDGNRKDIRNAVEAAQKAQGGWAKRSGHNRAQLLFYLAENLDIRQNEFAQLLRKLVGCSETEAEDEVNSSVQCLFHWASCCDKFPGSAPSTQFYSSVILSPEPLGVIGIACPDSNPLLSFLSLLAPAVCFGNTVVMIPSEKWPILALNVGQILDTSDFPGGVVNLVTGGRDHLTTTLVQHQDVQAVWYFGSIQGSAYVEFASSDNLKKTWVNYSRERDWKKNNRVHRQEIISHCTKCKTIWASMGEMFAN